MINDGEMCPRSKRSTFVRCSPRSNNQPPASTLDMPSSYCGPAVCADVVMANIHGCLSRNARGQVIPEAGPYSR